jgi:hypothetical protein
MIDEKVQKQRDAITAQMAKQIQLREAFKELDMAQANGREPADWALEQIANAL